MLSNTFTSDFLNWRRLSLSFVLDRDQKFLSLKKVGKTLFKVLLHFLNALIFTRIVLFFVPDSLAVHYLEANPCWYGFGTSSFTGSITQIPGFLLYPLTCTLLKPGITHTFIEIFIAAMIVVGIITLFFENKYFSQKPAIERDILNFRQMKGRIGAHLRIKWKQQAESNFAYIDKEMLPEVLRISGGSRFCWIDMYGGNVYGPIFWEERSEELENEMDIVVKTETELKSQV